MKYDVTKIEVTAGESIALTLKNQDAMPHNLVIVAPDAYQKIGMAAFKMVNTEDGGDRHYVPDDPDVIAYTHMVDPNGEHVTWFRAPETPGSYPFLCTFPGHWQLMKGTLIVKKKH